MIAWQALLNASQLVTGTAWELITNPKLGTGGPVIGPIIESDVLMITPQADLASDVLYSSALSQIVATDVSDEIHEADNMVYLLEAEVIV